MTATIRTEKIGDITVQVTEGITNELDASIKELVNKLSSTFQKSMTHLDTTGVDLISPEAQPNKQSIENIDRQLQQLYTVENELLKRLIKAIDQYQQIYQLLGETRNHQILAFNVIRDLTKFPAQFTLANKSDAMLQEKIASLEKLGFNKIPSDERMKRLPAEIGKSLASITTPHVQQQALKILKSYGAAAVEISSLQQKLNKDLGKIAEFGKSCAELDKCLTSVLDSYSAGAKKILNANPKPIVPGFMHSNQASAQKAEAAATAAANNANPASNNPNAKPGNEQKL